MINEKYIISNFVLVGFSHLDDLEVFRQYLFCREDDDAVPDVPGAVQDLLLNLFTTVYNHQDEEGRLEYIYPEFVKILVL